MLIHPIQWTIAKPVGSDQPIKHQKDTSCVSTGWPVPVLCIHQVVHSIYFLSRQHDVIASFSFGACTVQTCFQQSPDILRKSVDYDGFSSLFVNIMGRSVRGRSTIFRKKWIYYLQGIFIRVFCFECTFCKLPATITKKRQFLCYK